MQYIMKLAASFLGSFGNTLSDRQTDRTLNAIYDTVEAHKPEDYGV